MPKEAVGASSLEVFRLDGALSNLVYGKMLELDDL